MELREIHFHWEHFGSPPSEMLDQCHVETLDEAINVNDVWVKISRSLLDTKIVGDARPDHVYDSVEIFQSNPRRN